MISLARHRPRPHRTGLSIVEVLVALMLLSIGLLAMAGSTTLALRTTLDAARRRDAVQRAASRISKLSAAGCTGARSGSVFDPETAVREKWTLKPLSGGGFATITDSVSWTSAQGTKSFSLTSAVQC